MYQQQHQQVIYQTEVSELGGDCIMTKSYCIYCHTNTINGKKYIGQTCQDVHKRWQNGFGYREEQYIRKAIDKYGWDNFTHDILEENLSQDEANERERFYIQLYKTYNSQFGYNLTYGGNNGQPNDKTRKILSEKAKTRVGELNSRYGKHCSEEHKRKLREANIQSAMLNPIKCVESGIIYRNAADASRKLGIDKTGILKCSNGKQNQTHGLHFEKVGKEEYAA